MRLVLAAAGSRGDVQPILEIATVLQLRGHDVKVFAPRKFEPVLVERGLDAGYFRTDSDQLMQSLDHGWRSAKQALDWARTTLLEQFEVLVPALEGADALVTTVNELAAPTIAAHRRVSHFRLGYVPFLPGDQAPPIQPIQGLPAFVNRLLWDGVELATKAVFGGLLDQKRRELGLPRIRGPFSTYSAGYSHNLMGVDPVLSPPSRGWRFHYEYVGYPFGGDGGPLAPEVEAFLAGGAAPVYIGFGSVVVPDPDGTTKTFLRAVERVGCRAIIGQGWTGLGKGVRFPGDVLLVGASAHKTLFPRTAGVVHHGGSGTIHNAARAGVPQAIVPQIIDQYYWGRRVHELGIGPRAVPLAKLTEDKLVGLLLELFEPDHVRQAKVVGDLMRTDGAETAATAIESTVARRAAEGAQAERRKVVPIHTAHDRGLS